MTANVPLVSHESLCDATAPAFASAETPTRLSLFNPRNAATGVEPSAVIDLANCENAVLCGQWRSPTSLR